MGCESPRALVVATAVASLVVLSVGYAHFIYPQNAYLGFRFAPDSMRFAEALLLSVAVACLLPLRTERPAAFMAHFLAVFAVLPNLAYYGMSPQARLPIYVIVGTAVVCILVARCKWAVRVPRLSAGPALALAVAVGGVLAVLALAYARQGPPRVSFDLYAVYDLRAERTDPGGIGYATFWAASVLAPVMLALSLYRRSLLGIGIALAVQVLLFLYSGNKAALFQPVLVLAIFGLFRFRRPGVLLAGGVMVFIGLLFAISAWDPTVAEVAADFTVRRVLFVPAFLNFGYFEFFSTHEKVHLTSSILAGIAHYPYGDHSTGQVVGQYMGLGAGNATNGFLATGYMHFGILGALAFGGIVGLLLKLLDSFAGRLQTGLIVAISIPSYRALLTEADVSTAVVTHGVALALLLLWMLQRDSPKRPLRVLIPARRTV